jgi:hypothetical protein
MTRARSVIVLGLALAVIGCSSPLTTREKGALTGGAIGAGTGAIIGSQSGHTGTGALIGAGIGALGGAVIGDAIQGAEQKKTAAATPPPAPAPPPPPPVAIAPPPPVAVAAPPPVAAPAQPRLVWVPEWGMYVVEGQDVVYYNNTYYYFYGGRWYVSRAYTGPWVLVEAPPPAFAKLPKGPKGHLPPGLAKKGKVPPGWRDD